MSQYMDTMKIRIDNIVKEDANRLLAKVMERARTAIHQINSDCPIEFFIGIGDVHELCKDSETVKDYLKEVWENQDK